jgi:hypothetical protein
VSDIQEKQTPIVEEVVGATTVDVPTSNEDIFAEIFGDNSSEFAARDNLPGLTANEPSEQQPLGDPKEDNTQYQYWQSQSDKKQVEIDVLKGQMSEMMTAIKSPNPTASVAKEETVAVQKPVKPLKPGDFDHSEALADPDSSSAKYLAKQNEYVEDMSDYMVSADNQRNNELDQMRNQQRKAVQEQQLLADLQRNYGYTPNQADDFMKTMTSPDSVSLDNLVKLHKMDMDSGHQTITQVSDEAMRKQSNMRMQQSKLNIPRPIASQASVNMQSSRKTAENTMMDSMLLDHKKKNPFS